MEHTHYSIPGLFVFTSHKEDHVNEEPQKFEDRHCTEDVDYLERGLLVPESVVQQLMQLLILERTRYIRRLQGSSLHRESRCLFGGRGLRLRVDLGSVLIVSALLFDGRLFRVPD